MQRPIRQQHDRVVALNGWVAVHITAAGVSEAGFCTKTVPELATVSQFPYHLCQRTRSGSHDPRLAAVSVPGVASVPGLAAVSQDYCVVLHVMSQPAVGLLSGSCGDCWAYFRSAAAWCALVHPWCCGNLLQHTALLLVPLVTASAVVHHPLAASTLTVPCCVLSVSAVAYADSCRVLRWVTPSAWAVCWPTRLMVNSRWASPTWTMWQWRQRSWRSSGGPR